MGGSHKNLMKMVSTAVFACCVTLVAIVFLQQAAAILTEPRDEALDVRLTRFHSCLHRAESANHCMHLRPAELDDHVDDDLNEMADVDDDDDKYGIGEGLGLAEEDMGRGGGFFVSWWEHVSRRRFGWRERRMISVAQVGMRLQTQHSKFKHTDLYKLNRARSCKEWASRPTLVWSRSRHRTLFEKPGPLLCVTD